MNTIKHIKNGLCVMSLLIAPSAWTLEQPLKVSIDFPEQLYDDVVSEQLEPLDLSPPDLSSATTAEPIHSNKKGFELGVYKIEGHTVKPLNTHIISRRDSTHRLCWQVNSEQKLPQSVQVIESIDSPAATHFSSAYAKVSRSSDGRQHTIESVLTTYQGTRVERCWAFDQQDPVGQYRISISVDQVPYPTQSFELVN